MYTFESDDAYDLLVVHTNEGPEGPRSADALAAYLAGLNGKADPGYHIAVDENGAIVLAPDDVRVNGAGGYNSRAYHVCITGYAGQDPTQWSDRSSTEAMKIAAKVVRQKCDKLGIPLDRTYNPKEERGICGHADCSNHDPRSMGHTDPGTAFPWNTFMAMVKGVVTPEERKHEMFRIIKGDQSNQLWLTNWGEKRKITSVDEANAIVKAGVTDGQGTVNWPQAWVDNIPVKDNERDELLGVAALIDHVADAVVAKMKKK